MALRLCLDTSAYSYFKRGHVEAIAALDAAHWVGVPAIALGELRTGFALGTMRVQNEAELRTFLAEPVVNVLSVDEATSEIYADLLLALRRAGTPIPTNDIWIAALSVQSGSTVLTFDAHFEAVTRVAAQILQP